MAGGAAAAPPGGGAGAAIVGAEATVENRDSPSSSSLPLPLLRAAASETFREAFLFSSRSAAALFCLGVCVREGVLVAAAPLALADVEVESAGAAAEDEDEAEDGGSAAA